MEGEVYPGGSDSEPLTGVWSQVTRLALLAKGHQWPWTQVNLGHYVQKGPKSKGLWGAASHFVPFLCWSLVVFLFMREQSQLSQGNKRETAGILGAGIPGWQFCVGEWA